MTERSKATRYRTHTSTELHGADGGTEVIVCGFMAGRLNDRDPDFDLADAYGRIRVSLSPGATAALQIARDLGAEDVVQVMGTLKGNAPFAAGVKEVRATDIEVISRATALPVDPRKEGFEAKTSNTMRLANRHLDLRRPPMLGRLQLASTIRQVLRAALSEHGFVEVDTPVLGRYLPDSQATFIVPTSGYRSFALTDTPQLYKQMLMVGGVDRYYQITRCFRDEGRYDASHQPEFAVLDLEMAYADEADVYRVVNNLMGAVHSKVVGHPLPSHIPRVTFTEALSRYGTETPDLRFGLTIHDLTERAAASPSEILREAATEREGVRGAVLVIHVPGDKAQADDAPWKAGMNELLEAWPGVSHTWAEVKGDGLLGTMSDAFDEAGSRALVDELGAIDADWLCILVGHHRPITQRAAGAVRQHLGESLGLITEGAFAPVWVHEIPYYDYQMQGDMFVPIRHPFTCPLDDDLELLEAILAADGPPSPPDEERGTAFGDLLHLYTDKASRRRARLRSRGFELSLNGQELATGSIRNHDTAMQQKIFNLLHIDEDTAQRRFGPLLRALAAGVPPHGGLSIGLDRMVAIIAGVDDVRDVIAFPKDEFGRCLVTASPTQVQAADLHALLGQEPQAPASEAVETSEGAANPPLRRPSPVAAFSFTSEEFQLGVPVGVINRSQSLRPIASYVWECEALGLKTAEAQPTFTFTEPGEYQVVLTLTDADGHQSSAGAIVFIEAPDEDEQA